MANGKTKSTAEFGDFQTPRALAENVCALLGEVGVQPRSIVEPTCGVGGFLFAAADRWRAASTVRGIEINATHLEAARRRLENRPDASRIRVECSDFFTLEWVKLLAGLPEPVLVIGNPPWVTSAHVSRLGGSNVPVKSNFQGRNGLDAITGKANFDISEWMLMKLADALNGRDGVLAMLVKSAVARKLLCHCWKNHHSLGDASVYKIDAAAHFDAAVDASLVVLSYGRSKATAHANVYGQLTRVIRPVTRIGLAGDTIIADLDAYEQTRHLVGSSPLKWRSGVKHDCAKVMELRRDRDRIRNGFGETVELEGDYLFPMLKTSEVAGGNTGACARWMVVPQRRIGDSTAEIAERAPKTWAYLQAHRSRLEKRGSSIYRGKPDFSIFGVGDYSFAPWKVAISGMYKTLRFVKVGSCDGKPVVFDDVTNFMPCRSEAAASLLLSMLESEPARMFYRAFVFWDAKRPVTVELLGRLSLHALSRELGTLDQFEEHFGVAHAASPKRRNRRPPALATPTLWATDPAVETVPG